jgi:hypothetical protein
MTEPKLLQTTEAVSDAGDIETLWLDPSLGDGITDARFHAIPVDKPKDFFRCHPGPDYRRRAEIFIHKQEGMIEESAYILAPEMRGRIPEARPCTLVTVIYRDGSLRLWPIKFPREGEKDNEAWRTARVAARIAMERWVKLVWVRRAYQTREAMEGYAPDPDYRQIPPFNDLVRIAFGEHGIIRDENHPIFRELFGAPKKVDKDDAADL